MKDENTVISRPGVGPGIEYPRSTVTTFWREINSLHISVNIYIFTFYRAIKISENGGRTNDAGHPTRVLGLSRRRGEIL